jgi:hypothetical protein
MKSESNFIEIQDRIIQLTLKNQYDKQEMLTAFNDVLIELKPINLIKNSVTDLISTPGLTQSILNTGLGMAAGFASKKIAIGNSQNPLKMFLGFLIEVGMTALVSKNITKDNHTEG